MNSYHYTVSVFPIAHNSIATFTYKIFNAKLGVILRLHASLKENLNEEYTLGNN